MQNKNESIQSKIIPILKLPRFFPNHTGGARWKGAANSKLEIFLTEWSRSYIVFALACEKGWSQGAPPKIETTSWHQLDQSPVPLATCPNLNHSKLQNIPNPRFHSFKTFSCLSERNTLDPWFKSFRSTFYFKFLRAKAKTFNAYL